jgi:hypothetical protein
MVFLVVAFPLIMLEIPISEMPKLNSTNERFNDSAKDVWDKRIE